MERASAGRALLVGLAALGACRPGTVHIDPAPKIGDRATYRYVIAATITSELDDADPTITTIATTLVVDQTVIGVTDGGAEADVRLRRDGGPVQTARVVLDATGAIRDVELVAGLGDDGLGLSQLGALLPPTMVPPPVDLAPGARWAISVGPISGHGRLDRLGVERGRDVAIVRTSVTQAIDEAVTSGTNVATLAGTLHSTSSATYDLRTGSVRRSSTHSTGDVRASIEPPTGIDADPVLGRIDYDVRVRATRLT